MAQDTSVTKKWRLVLPHGLYRDLHDHLFPGDGDEHGAVIAAGIADGGKEIRLLARSLHLAIDGVDYVPGKRGYRMLRAEFISKHIEQCAEERLVYLAIHNHGGHDQVGFSGDDLRSHERGYPALLDIVDGLPVGGLVFAPKAIAGDIWLPGERRVRLASASVVGNSLCTLTPAPTEREGSSISMYDRQARLFGDAGQDILAHAKVGIIGLGGVGSLLAEYLGRLGVGHFVLVDPDRVEMSNLPRLIAASPFDAMEWLTAGGRPKWLRGLGIRLARTKVAAARRNILRANPKAYVESIFGDFLEDQTAQRFVDCDYLFLAADMMRARLLFNAIVHQYLVPGVQIGSKVQIDRASGDIEDVFSVVRPVTPESGCLLCNRLINSTKLQEESISPEDRKRQRYVDEPEIVAPSVVTLNATAASQAANDFLFYITGMRDPTSPQSYLRFEPMCRGTSFDAPAKSRDCPECGKGARSRLARGQDRRLPVIDRSVRVSLPAGVKTRSVP
jgi:molybdopterin/thiamine biosynthesis adenylyltransferase